MKSQEVCLLVARQSKGCPKQTQTNTTDIAFFWNVLLCQWTRFDKYRYTDSEGTSGSSTHSLFAVQGLQSGTSTWRFSLARDKCSWTVPRSGPCAITDKWSVLDLKCSQDSAWRFCKVFRHVFESSAFKNTTQNLHAESWWLHAESWERIIFMIE